MATDAMEAAVAALYRDHGRATARLAHLLTGDLTLAEDIVQDAFVRLLGRLTSIRDPEALSAYLKQTVVNLAKNHHRSESRARQFRSRHLSRADDLVSLPDVEGRDQLRAALLALPYRQRAALVLRYCEDLPEARVATVLGTSPKGVRSLVGRGLSTLRDLEGRNDRE